MLCKFAKLGSMSVSEITLPMPFGANVKLPLVSKVVILLSAMTMLLNTGPAAKI
jgi:hypothetical protein